jgi:hypothetical protein
MVDTALTLYQDKVYPDISKLNKKQMAFLSQEHNKAMVHETINKIIDGGTNVGGEMFKAITPLFTNEKVAWLAIWLSIELLNKRMFFGTTPENSAKSASQIAALIFIPEVAESIIDIFNPFK